MTAVAENTNSQQQNKNEKYRRHYCPFCKKLVGTISRHLKTVHSTEEDVIKLQTLPPNERKYALQALRLKGDNEYNMNNTDKIFVRRPKYEERKEIGVRCYKCEGWYAKHDFSRHNRRCTGRTSNKQRVTKQAEKNFKLQVAMQSTSDRIQTQKEEFLCDLLEDDITLVIKEDTCLNLLSQHYANLHKTSLIEQNNSRQNLRRLARILLKVREINPKLPSYQHILAAQNYDILMDAIISLWKDKPTVILVLNSTIKHLVEVVKKFYIKENTPDSEGKISVLENFLIIHKSDYRIHVAKEARIESVHRKLSKVNFLPTSSDVKKYSDYLKISAEQSYNQLLTSNRFDYNTWLNLGKAVLLQV